LFAQLVSKIFNLCSHDPPTSQTDRQTDDMRSQDRALHYSALRGKNRPTINGTSTPAICRSNRKQHVACCFRFVVGLDVP